MQKNKVISTLILLIISPFFYRAYLYSKLDNQILDLISMLIVIIGVASAFTIGFISSKEEE